MNPAARSHGKGPKSTPVLYDGKVFTLGIEGVLSAFDSSVGDLVWQKDFRNQFRSTSPLYGTAMSPIIANNLLVVHVGGHDDGALAALSVDSGEVLWDWEGDGPGYASPILVDLEGVRQVVTQSQDHVIGVALDSGKLLWKLPLKTSYSQNSVTPLLHGGDLILSGLDNGVIAVHVTKQGNSWTPEISWKNEDLSMYMNSPVAVGNSIYGMSHRSRGQFFCLDGSTGISTWKSPGRQGENAAFLAAETILFVLRNDAELIIAKASKEAWEPVKQYTVASSPTWAHPVILGDKILIKDEDTLALWTWAADPFPNQ
jgi:outer membrane protein assembly factor BamB